MMVASDIQMYIYIHISSRGMDTWDGGVTLSRENMVQNLQGLKFIPIWLGVFSLLRNLWCRVDANGNVVSALQNRSNKVNMCYQYLIQARET